MRADDAAHNANNHARSCSIPLPSSARGLLPPPACSALRKMYERPYPRIGMRGTFVQYLRAACTSRSTLATYSLLGCRMRASLSHSHILRATRRWRLSHHRLPSFTVPFLALAFACQCDHACHNMHPVMDCRRRPTAHLSIRLLRAGQCNASVHPFTVLPADQVFDLPECSSEWLSPAIVTPPTSPERTAALGGYTTRCCTYCTPLILQEPRRPHWRNICVQ